MDKIAEVNRFTQRKFTSDNNFQDPSLAGCRRVNDKIEWTARGRSLKQHKEMQGAT